MAGPSTSFTDDDEILDELDDCDSIFSEISIQNEKQIIEEDRDSDCELNHSENSSENIVVNDGNLDDESDVLGLETVGNDREEFDQFVDNVIELGQGDANNRDVGVRCCKIWGVGWVRKVCSKGNETVAKGLLEESNVVNGSVTGCAILLEPL
ncbi:hypothetical protein J6590_097884 [Homalodisca vitripennis]|nr:hypothetical protein J6590_097884 [Homalodisca vitripennis]